MANIKKRLDALEGVRPANVPTLPQYRAAWGKDPLDWETIERGRIAHDGRMRHEDWLGHLE